MAIDQVSESVQRQERPNLSIKDYIQKLSVLKLEEDFSENVDPCDNEIGIPQGIKGLSGLKIIKNTAKEAKEAKEGVWPPLKSARYCKKQRQRNGKPRGLSHSMMLLHESSINHQRVACAMNELNGLGISVFDPSSTNIYQNNRPFWSKQSCQDFWDDYVECDSNLSLHSDLSALSLDENRLDDWSCPMYRYSKINRSMRKLLKRTFTGAVAFSELEDLVTKTLSPKLSIESTGVEAFDFSCGQVLNVSAGGATVKLDTPFHRVWLHAICRYYGLLSQSKTVDNLRLVHIKSTSLCEKMDKPEITLYSLLKGFSE